MKSKPIKRDVISDFVGRVYEQVEIIALKDKLDEFISECESLTQTNCGWQEFYLAKITIDYARYLRAIRDKEATK